MLLTICLTAHTHDHSYHQSQFVYMFHFICHYHIPQPPCLIITCVHVFNIPVSICFTVYTHPYLHTCPQTCHCAHISGIHLCPLTCMFQSATIICMSVSSHTSLSIYMFPHIPPLYTCHCLRTYPCLHTCHHYIHMSWSTYMSPLYKCPCLHIPKLFSCCFLWPLCPNRADPVVWLV